MKTQWRTCFSCINMSSLTYRTWNPLRYSTAAHEETQGTIFAQSAHHMVLSISRSAHKRIKLSCHTKVCWGNTDRKPIHSCRQCLILFTLFQVSRRDVCRKMRGHENTSTTGWASWTRLYRNVWNIVRILNISKSCIKIDSGYKATWTEP